MRPAICVCDSIARPATARFCGKCGAKLRNLDPVIDEWFASEPRLANDELYLQPTSRKARWVVAVALCGVLAAFVFWLGRPAQAAIEKRAHPRVELDDRVVLPPQPAAQTPVPRGHRRKRIAKVEPVPRLIQPLVAPSEALLLEPVRPELALPVAPSVIKLEESNEAIRQMRDGEIPSVLQRESKAH